jgi:uncharacterized protein
MKSKIILTIGISCVFIFMTSCGSGNTSNNEAPKKIEVTGSAEMEFVPNEISMTFTMKEYFDGTRKKIKLEIIKAAFLKQCKAAGVADSNVSISSYSGNERWDYYWYKRRKTEPDFLSGISYAVKVSSAEKLDQLVATVDDLALENFYISKTSHSDIELLRKEVKTKALQASKMKAEYLAKSVGEEIGETLLIQEIEDSYRGGYYTEAASYNSNAISQTAMSLESERAAAESAPNFEKIKIRYEMKVAFKLK